MNFILIGSEYRTTRSILYVLHNILVSMVTLHPFASFKAQYIQQSIFRLKSIDSNRWL